MPACVCVFGQCVRLCRVIGVRSIGLGFVLTLPHYPLLICAASSSHTRAQRERPRPLQLCRMVYSCNACSLSTHHNTNRKASLLCKLYLACARNIHHTRNITGAESVTKYASSLRVISISFAHARNIALIERASQTFHILTPHTFHPVIHDQLRVFVCVCVWRRASTPNVEQKIH